MNKLIVGVSVAVLLLGGSAIGFAFAQAVNDDEDNKAIVQLADAPAPVRAAIAKLTSEKNVRQVARETDAAGRTTFDVEYDAQGRALEAEISDSGDVLEVSTAINADALPAAAANAIAAAYPGGTIKAAESKEVFFYEVVVMADGREHEVQVTANGQIGDDDDDADDGGEDEDEDESEDEEEDE